ncbi:L-lactate dehydrogenase [Kwoniella heveanensis BCC8398]|uniref:L-lactate dehydrogenase n=1 Tax=Kwoniella heveanensis BCC8398 TaxID=1296120 RepID=A0A1B9GWT5_9TREE|nr:L-lactate dehydrogenase [Kwoniella heveanensis BCC8398]
MLVQQHLSPLRAALNAKVRAGVRPIGRSARSLKSNAFSTSTSMRTKTQTQTQQRFLIGAGIALAVPTYLYLNRAHLDSDAQPDKVHSDVPDKVHSTQDGKTGAVAGVKKISSKEILDKKDGEEVWVVIEGEVYDMTEFLDEHPGGREIIENNRSKDVTYIFKPRHPSDQLEAENIPPSVRHLGQLTVESQEERDALKVKVSKDEEEENDRIQRKREEIEEKGLGTIVNMRDFEKAAEDMCSKVAWAYYASAADDEITKEDNNSDYKNIRFRPRVLRPVKEADASTKILGYDSKIPLWISPAAMAKLGHPLGEVNLTRGAHSSGIIQCISSFASCSIEEITAARAPGQPLFFQLYVNSKRHLAKEVITKINRLGLNAILLTVDAPVGGKRERDIRAKGAFEAPKTEAFDKQGETKGVAEAIFSAVDPDLNWKDLKWLREQTELPIIIKGVQTVEDAVMAYKNGADGVILSNHGGRQLDTTQTGLSTLLEIRKHAPFLLRPEYRIPTGPNPQLIANPEKLYPDPPSTEKSLDRKFSIFVDGGIWRGSDAVKALCLGADAVGVGRGFLFAQTVGGQQGVEHAVKIFESEILLTMRLLGANKVQDLRPSMVEVMDSQHHHPHP